ncbi:peptidylprolyl isomerase [Galbibacter pacificus]|uniref:Peptidyl-prolyl cis-trans isomerase n=1 Tax=Galbibacter pacificus TaxID=2996052 RepID=A0ABT6FRG0_9FLAO|nr:peptidylprolyl isomerase [Galbibacter pacificus]MDG3581668.1 peptidylprolyl isomerase [Galbibacter pacificus]MDG3585858.1 peptidylprolyl isomerase [Galbibacter pacificus]
MQYYTVRAFTILLLFILSACGNSSKKEKGTSREKTKDTVKIDSAAIKKAQKEKEEEKRFVLTEDNAIPFLFEYQKEHKEHKVRIRTSKGSFVIDLYEKTPYHRANFIYLTKKEYFNGTYFHRVVKDFIIQGGNTDMVSTAKRRDSIGFYLLPPDTRKGYTHSRGTVSMPSSDDVANPHKLASPYEFFIVTAKNGAHHLDGKYTAFGKVVSGMDVVDKINNVPTGDDEWPLTNVVIKSVEIIE